VAELRQLQRTLGNQNVQLLLEPRPGPTGRLVSRVIDTSQLNEEQLPLWRLVNEVFAALNPDLHAFLTNSEACDLVVQFNEIDTRDVKHPKGATSASAIGEKKELIDLNPDANSNLMDIFFADRFLILVQIDIIRNKTAAEYLQAIAHEIQLHLSPYATIIRGILSAPRSLVDKHAAIEAFAMFKERAYGKKSGVLTRQHTNPEAISEYSVIVELLTQYLLQISEAQKDEGWRKLAHEYYLISKQELDDLDVMSRKEGLDEKRKDLSPEERRAREILEELSKAKANAKAEWENDELGKAYTAIGLAKERGHLALVSFFLTNEPKLLQVAYAVTNAIPAVRVANWQEAESRTWNRLDRFEIAGQPERYFVLRHNYIGGTGLGKDDVWVKLRGG
jgi:hypothetical protein